MGNKGIILKFLQGINTLQITTEQEMILLINTLKDFEYSEIDLFNKYPTLDSWCKLVFINHRKYTTSIILECDPYKGITFYPSEEEARKWYGTSPYQLI